jgi:hypothetical protein
VTGKSPVWLLAVSESTKVTRINFKLTNVYAIEQANDDDESDSEEIRHFRGELPDDEKELLPLKIDGSLIRRIEKIDTDIKSEVDEYEEEENESELEATTGN